MDASEKPVIDAIGRGVLTAVAPEELPMYGIVARAHAAGARRKDPSTWHLDDPLAFGVGETVVLLAPVAVVFAEKVWDALTDEAVAAGVKSLTDALRRLLGRDDQPGPEPLTAEQLAHVREVGADCAGDLPLTPEERTLFVNALVGLLAVPPRVSEAGERSDAGERSEETEAAP